MRRSCGAGHPRDRLLVEHSRGQVSAHTHTSTGTRTYTRRMSGWRSAGGGEVARLIADELDILERLLRIYHNAHRRARHFQRLRAVLRHARRMLALAARASSTYDSAGSAGGCDGTGDRRLVRRLDFLADSVRSCDEMGKHTICATEECLVLLGMSYHMPYALSMSSICARLVALGRQARSRYCNMFYKLRNARVATFSLGGEAGSDGDMKAQLLRVPAPSVENPLDQHVAKLEALTALTAQTTRAAAGVTAQQHQAGTSGDEDGGAEVDFISFSDPISHRGPKRDGGCGRGNANSATGPRKRQRTSATSLTSCSETDVGEVITRAAPRVQADPLTNNITSQHLQSKRFVSSPALVGSANPSISEKASKKKKKKKKKDKKKRKKEKTERSRQGKSRNSAAPNHAKQMLLIRPSALSDSDGDDNAFAGGARDAIDDIFG